MQRGGALMLTSVFSILPRPSHQHVARTVHAQTRGEVSPAAVCPATTCQSIIRVWNASMQVHVLAALTLLIASAIKDLLGPMVDSAFYAGLVRTRMCTDQMPALPVPRTPSLAAEARH